MLIDLEILLVKAFGWSLHDIDETDIESLMPFIRRLTQGQTKPTKQTYCDQVDWL